MPVFDTCHTRQVPYAKVRLWLANFRLGDIANMQDEATAPLIDAGTAPEIYCDDLARVEAKGHNARFTFIVHQIGPSGERERFVNFKMIFPVDAVGPAIELTYMTLGSGLIVPVTKFIASRLFH